MKIKQFDTLEKAVRYAQANLLPSNDIYIGALPNQIMYSSRDWHNGYGVILDREDKERIVCI